MNRTFPSLPFTVSPLILTAAIAAAGMVKANDGLAHPGFEITASNTALQVADTQNDFLHPDGVAWDVVGYAAALTNFCMIATHVADANATVTAVLASAD